jgi:hypothetical protein
MGQDNFGFPKFMILFLFTAFPRTIAGKLILMFLIGGEREIRTLDRVTPMPVFKTGAFGHSAISPMV